MSDDRELCAALFALDPVDDHTWDFVDLAHRAVDACPPSRWALMNASSSKAQRPFGISAESTSATSQAHGLDAPVRAGGVGKNAKATYHLAISTAPTDRPAVV